MIRVQEQPFDLAEELGALRQGNHAIGGTAIFLGSVRDLNLGEQVSAMTLEHYPGMTEKELARIEEEARSRWPLQASLIVHRIGTLLPGDNIVLVITASAHREAAFEAARFLMDYLKTSAPFWKREKGPDGEHWVEAKETDDQAAAVWREQ